MKKQIARIKVFINPESRESSVTTDFGAAGGPGTYSITVNGGEGPYAVRSMSDFQTTLAHELGHVIALITRDESHAPKNTFAQRPTSDGTHNLNIPAEEKAWEFAHTIWPELNEDSERLSMQTYHDARKEPWKYGVIAEPQDVPFEENVMGNVSNEENYWAGSKLTPEDLARLATLLADPNAAKWHSHCSQQFMFDALDNRKEYLSDLAMMADTPTLPEPSFDDFGRWEDDGGSCWHNVVVYHGTTRRAAESIKREGLKPNLDGAFRMQRTDAGERVIENHRLAYVTPVKEMAEAFARLRAKYERAPKGTVLMWTGLYEPDEVRDMGEEPAEMRKLSTKREPNAEPAIVEIELPDDWKSRLEPDPSGSESLGFVYQGTIPAEYVEAIEPVAWRNAVTPTQASHDLADMESDLDEDAQEESEHYAIDTPDYEPNGAAFARFMREWAEQNSHVTNLWGNVAPTDEPINPVSAPTWFWMAAFALMFLLAAGSTVAEILDGFAEIL